MFPLEPVTAHVGTCNKKEKIPPEMLGGLRFWAPIRRAREVFRDLSGILGFQAFDQVAWRRPVYDTLLSVPRLFQLLVAKQVTGIAGTNLRLHIYSWRKPNPHYKLCTSCGAKTEDCEHVLTCEESNRVDCLLKCIDRLDKWLGGAGHGATASHGPCLVCKGQRWHDNACGSLRIGIHVWPPHSVAGQD